jgi:hypothetical protein
MRANLTLAALAAAGFLMLGLALALCSGADAHDRHHPDLDQWYGSLQRPGVSPYSGGFSCCNKTDCHTTQAEIRGDKWWARIGVKNKDGDWDLLDWIEIPPEKILEGHDNPTGEAVICHSIGWGLGVPQTVVPALVTIYCFVPPVKS